MPHQIEGMKVAEEGGFPAGRLALWMMAALAVGILASYWSILHLYYHEGAGTAKVNAWRKVQSASGEEMSPPFHFGDLRPRGYTTLGIFDFATGLALSF